MSRPLKCRRVSFLPGATYFKPAGIPLRVLEEVRLSVEEAEAMRLKDIEGLEQEQGAKRMNISRPTFQRVLVSSRRKIADALLNGKAIRIEGGSFEMAFNRFKCLSGHEWEVPFETMVGAPPRLCPVCNTSDFMPFHPLGSEESCAQTVLCRRQTKIRTKCRLGGIQLMKIAAISEDGITVSQHFGRAPLYVVVAVEGGKVVSKETRAKAGHHTFAANQHPDTAPGERHGYDAGAQLRHATMAQSIDDCQVLIAGGMGWGAYDSLKSRGIETIVTDVENIEEAVRLYVEGKLPNLMERLH